jgi:uncharacterized SAM-binding protein YcdF (DUF218 family)
MSTRRRIATAVQALGLVLLIVLVDMWISGHFVFQKAEDDALQHADAIIVLGGEHDGREDFGIQLAKEGWASTVVLSNPYGPDGVMERVCHNVDGERGPVDVLCPVPDPLTTRGEALMTRDLAAARGWTKVIIVSWRYHLPRAQYIFRQCFSDVPGSTIMRAVPKRYQFSPLTWEFLYSYQWGGLAKALYQGECS